MTLAAALLAWSPAEGQTGRPPRPVAAAAADTPLWMPPGANPLAGLRLSVPDRGDRIFHRGKLFLFQSAGATKAVDTRPGAASGKPTSVGPENRRRAAGVLMRMGRFLERQDAFACKLDWTIIRADEWTVSGLTTALAMSGPDRFAMSTSRGGRFFRGFRCNGAHLLREDERHVYVEPARGAIADMLDRPAVKPVYPDDLDGAAILSLLYTTTLERMLKKVSVYYGGTKRFGDVTADHVLVDFGGPQHYYNFFHLYVWRSETPLPLLIVPALTVEPNRNLRYQDMLVRSAWRFRDWEFNSPAAEDLFVLKMPAKDLVESVGYFSGEKPPELDPLVGARFPDILGVGPSGEAIRSRDMAGGPPFVVLAWGNGFDEFGRDWNAYHQIERRFADRGVKVYTVYRGRADREEVVQRIRRGRAKYRWAAPPRVACAGSPPLENMAAYVVSGEGVVQQVVPPGGDAPSKIASQLEGLLRGRDMAQANRLAVAGRDELLRRRREQLIKAFASARR